MINYAQHFSTLQTPQSEPAEPRQVKNSAGGYTFALDCWKRLDRWLILGAEGGTYYASERRLTRENAATVIECLDADGPRAVAVIVAISEAGRAPKNDPAIFALAIAAGHKDPRTRADALAVLPRVCRTATHLFQFATMIRAFRGWGRSLRRAIGDWYGDKTAEQLAYQLCKYQQRGGYSHRDLMRLAHPKPEHAALYRWVTAGAEHMGERTVTSKTKVRAYPAAGDLPEYVQAFEQLKRATTAAEAVPLILAHQFTHEMVPSDLKNSPEVWEALLAHMPMTALVRNLAKLSAVGLLKPLSKAAGDVCAQLADAERIRKARVHPIQMLSALRVYASGQGVKGSLTWEPVPQVIQALDAAFYLAFGNVEPSGKRTLLALDVSGSMSWETKMGVPGLTARVGSAAMAMVTMRTEPAWHVVGFQDRLLPLPITPQQRLDDVCRAISNLPFGRTDCAQPMLYAAGNGLEVDSFIIYTDNETWCGNIHPHQALRAYRAKSGINARLAVVGMTATGFSIADPSDAGMLDVVGFDLATPNLLADFAKGG